MYPRRAKASTPPALAVLPRRFHQGNAEHGLAGGLADLGTGIVKDATQVFQGRAGGAFPPEVVQSMRRDHDGRSTVALGFERRR